MGPNARVTPGAPGLVLEFAMRPEVHEQAETFTVLSSDS
jgi:hypothetical protein